MGHENGGSFPLATRYARSTVGNSDNRLPEDMTPELPDALEADDVSGDGVFADGPNTNLDYGAFADNVSLPGYAARENGFGPSETIDWQTGQQVAVFASGLFNNIADQGVFPHGRGPQYVPNQLDLARTDFTRNELPATPIYSNPGIGQKRVRGADPMAEQAAELAQIAALQGLGSSPSPLSALLMQRQIVPQARIGVMDLIQQRGPATALSGLDVASIPTWQWALIGVAAGAVTGAVLSIVLPAKKSVRR